jgi:hypothetical protein
VEKCSQHSNHSAKDAYIFEPRTTSALLGRHTPLAARAPPGCRPDSKMVKRTLADRALRQERLQVFARAALKVLEQLVRSDFDAPVFIMQEL